MTPHQHTQLKKWATDLHPKPGEGHLYDLLHEAIDAAAPVACELRELTHAEAYAALNPKVGERFRVVRRVEPEGWIGGWTADKEACIGCRWVASSVEPSHGVYLTGLLGTHIGYFPANALERVEE